MSDLCISAPLPPSSPSDLQALCSVTSYLLRQKPVEVPVEHFLHAGTYIRTCFLPKGAAIVGALIKVPTVVIVSGRCQVTAGPAIKAIDGYAVLRAEAGRRQCFAALEDTYITMLFASNAKTVADAEKEFTDEWDLLTTNAEGGLRGKV